ncbi:MULTISPECIES: lysozyme family protein [Bacillus subtilis group]|nr:MULTISPECIES: lysozyme family protein [Bacillus subtilis group]AKQ74004.1 hypothetical protein MUY_002872 [Bacillus licheniformis WX-02]MDE1392079.1 lysozyme family protein [Bacillus paralicheniformis]MEC1037700.1 lysozyme family protein [Bacillus licheniformis]
MKEILKGVIARILTKKILFTVGIPATIIIFFLLVIGGAVLTIFSDNPSSSGTGDGLGTCGQLINVPEKVQKYRGIVEKELEKQGFTKDYTNCMIAQIMQESGGNPPDVFQASESKYGKIGMIDSVEESVEQGVKRWVEIKKQIESKGFPFSIDLLLQIYNFGSNYLNWLDKTNQLYSLDTAFEYSAMFYEKLKSQGIYKCHFPEQKNKACYGDFMYVPHIKRYISDVTVDPSMKGDFQFPFVGINFVVTSEYGSRWGTLHAGIDLVAYDGAAVSSIGDGIVIDSRFSNSYGNVITIQHPNGVFSRYAHLSKRTVSTGEKVKKGQVIGAQGNTGASQGSHLHFETRRGNDYKKGTSFNPRDLLPFPPGQS